MVLLTVNVCALLSCARSQDQQTTAGLAEYMAAVEYLAAIETNKPVQQTTAGLVECDVPVLVRMLIPLIQQKTIGVPQAQHIDKFVVDVPQVRFLDPVEDVPAVMQ